jgi:two-component sensor histidine kinase
MVENSPDGHLVFENGQCTYYSPSYRHVVGAAEDDQISNDLLSLPELLHPDDRQDVLAGFQAARDANRPTLCYSFRGKTKTGVYCRREDCARLFYDENGNHVKTIVVARRLEGRHPAPSPKWSSSDSVTLNNEIYHRVKNDLELVRSMLSLQAGDSSEDRVQSQLEVAADRVAALGMMYDALHHSDSPTSIDASTLLQSLLPGLEWRAGTVGATIECDVDDGIIVPAKVARSLNIIITETVTNAVKHGDVENGRTHIGLRIAHSTDRPGLVLVVRDSGPGFPDGVLEGDQSGFGLAATRSLVDDLDGTLHLRNQNGAIVEIALPASATGDESKQRDSTRDG